MDIIYPDVTILLYCRCVFTIFHAVFSHNNAILQTVLHTVDLQFHVFRSDTCVF